MSRLYLVVFLLFSAPLHAQNLLGKYLDFADQQYAKGDYIYALEFYQKALEIDSNTVSILWRYAETLRNYKDYRTASYYYQKVYEKEETAIYPSSLLQWALMEKQNGRYENAIDLFKRAKKKYAKDKRTYEYKKSKRELESCLWAQSALKDTSELESIDLPKGLNTSNSEFGHTIHNQKFIFSSMRSIKEGNNEEMLDQHYKNRLYQATWIDTVKQISPSLISALNSDEFNTGNGSFSKDGKRFYFSKCGGDENKFQCQIYISTYSNGKWATPVVLSELVNEPGANVTTPSVAYVDGEEWLVFSSDREKGDGGMDLYFVVMKNQGNQFSKIKALNAANSPDNEIAPYYNESEKRMYFSSSWHDGFGGYDVHYLQLTNGTFEKPRNVGLPINSPANDVYFFQDGDSMYVSSNRLGVNYVKNPTCCSDVFGYKHPRIIVPETKKETLADLNKRLPVTLYFHNDVPNPRSKEPTTTVNYVTSYNDYLAMLPEYRKEYAKGLSGEKVMEAEEDIESFFLEYVEQGYKDLVLFQNLLFEELQKGLRIRLNVKGFASPLAKTDYNVNLTKRRIMSLQNYLLAFDNGVFAPYLNGTAPNGGKLEIQGVPFGEYTANQVTSDNPNDTKNSVFSRAAAIERKIEIQSVSYLDTDSLFFMVDFVPNVITLGKIKPNGIPFEFNIYNHSDSDLAIDSIVSNATYFQLTYPKQVNAGKTITIHGEPKTNYPMGIFSNTIYVYINGFKVPLRINLLGEAKE